MLDGQQTTLREDVYSLHLPTLFFIVIDAYQFTKITNQARDCYNDIIVETYMIIHFMLTKGINVIILFHLFIKMLRKEEIWSTFLIL